MRKTYSDQWKNHPPILVLATTLVAPTAWRFYLELKNSYSWFRWFFCEWLCDLRVYLTKWEEWIFWLRLSSTSEWEGADSTWSFQEAIFGLERKVTILPSRKSPRNRFSQKLTNFNFFLYFLFHTFLWTFSKLFWDPDSGLLPSSTRKCLKIDQKDSHQITQIVREPSLSLMNYLDTITKRDRALLGCSLHVVKHAEDALKLFLVQLHNWFWRSAIDS